MTAFMSATISYLVRHAFFLIAISCYAANAKEEAVFFTLLAFYIRLDDLLTVTAESRAIAISVQMPTPDEVTPAVAEGEAK